MRNQSQGGRARRLAPIAVTLVATALIVTYFRAEVAVHEDRYVTEQVEQALTKSAALLQEAKVAQAISANAEPRRRALEGASVHEDRYITEQVEQALTKSAASLQEAKAAQAMATAAEPQRRALEEAQARAAALASELAGKSREIETQAAQSQKAADAATKQKQATESTIAELRQSLEQEQKKTATLMQEAKAAQAMATAAEPQRRALEEAQARAAALASELDGATKHKQAAEANALELQKSLQQERDRTEAMAGDLATVRRTMDGRVTVGPSADSYVTGVTQKAKTAAMEPPKAAEAQGRAEAAKLIERASGLLGQGNIGAARIVLERAAESGNARASFMLAETYDPVILSAWGTYGTRGEAAKAREYYAKAYAGGIQEAKGRLDAMRQ
jgi:DNA repair exonuclease SbcCD ATPase subunit